MRAGAAEIAIGLALATVLAGGSPERFHARLTPMPMDVSMRADMTGKGSASAVLAGRTLSVTGTFEGLGGPATIARIHQGPAMGVRGPAIGDLSVSHAASGAINGSLELTAQ